MMNTTNQTNQNLSLINTGATVAGTILSSVVAGSTVPVLGTAAGFVVGVGVALTHVITQLFGAKNQLKEIKRAAFRAMIQQYNKAIFAGALNRIEPAMEDLIELGLKPGTPQFESLLVQKIGPEVGYQGNCKVSLYTPNTSGQKDLLATIDRNGAVTLGNSNNSQYFDTSVGPQWATACKQTYLDAFQLWASEQENTIEYQRMLQDQQQQAQQVMWTTALVSIGVGMVLIGFTLREKGKLDA